MTNNNNKNKNAFSSLKNQLNQWYNALIIVILIGTGVGNYMVSNYRHDQRDKEYLEFDLRLKKVEAINYELLLEQLSEIKSLNTKLNNKIDKTNERVDKVLEILLSK